MTRWRDVAALALARLAQWLAEGSEHDPEGYDPEEPDPVTESRLGPVTVQHDWEGDMVACYPGSAIVDERLAAYVMLAHCRRVANGLATTYQA